MKNSGRVKPKSVKIKKSPGRILGRVFTNLVMITYSVTCIYPIFWMIYSSLKTSRDFETNIIGLPRAIEIENYIQVFTGGKIGIYMLNTVRNTAISLIFIVIFSFINGYFLSRFRFPGRKVLYTLYMLGMLVPIHALLIPLYILFTRTGLTNSWYTVALPNIAFNLPVAIFLIESYIGTVPREIEEAAIIDGSGFSRTLFTIIFPLVTPILVTVGIISFFNCWNEFSFSLVLLKNQRLFSLPLGLTLFKGIYQSNYPRMMTTMVIAMAPALVIYFAFSRKIIQGMMSGAIKG
ncbi:MAG: carbohydrate ABC transporter permease [Treponema sp.]|jgi:raffinose/stachyose/melibiose transport system permease protein|nr:carbohydrate ABC transporter permease [Treponema sp.]